MTKRHLGNYKNDSLVQVVDLLDNLIAKLSLSKEELARKMQIDKGTFSRIYNKEQKPSRRIVLIAQLLLENIEHQERIAELESALRTTSTLPNPNAINEVTAKTGVSEATKQEILRAVEEALKKQKSGL